MEVLKNLQEDELDCLRAEFDGFGSDTKGLTIDQFSEVLLKAAHGKQISNHSLLSKDRLHDLFNEIDFNGDTRVSWEEFTMFVIDSMLKGKYEGDEVIKSYVNVKTSKVPIGETCRGDGFAMAAEINHLKYFPDLNEICKVSTFGKETRLKLIDPVTMRGTSWTPKLPHSIVTVEAIPDADALVTSSGGMHMHFWDTSPRPPGIPGRSQIQDDQHTLLLKKQVAVPETQLAMRWCRRYNTLFSASRTGALNYWSMEKMEIVKTQPRVHDEAILDLLVVDHEVITASLDSTVKMLNLERNAVCTGVLKGHEQGVCRLAYSKPHQFLISAGFEYEPLVWVLHIKDFRPWRLTDKQQPHHGTIQGLFSVPDTPQVITADSQGMVKVWDLRTFQAVQTILPWQHAGMTHNFSKGNLANAVCHVESTDSIVMSAHGSTFVYRYQQTDNHTSADNVSVVTAIYNEHSRSIVSVHKKGVKIWNEVTGLIESVFDDLVFGADEITSFCLCYRGRKFFLGTMSGMIYCYAMSNAAHGFERRSFNTSVTDMIYGDDCRMKVLIAISQTDSPSVVVVSDSPNWPQMPCAALNILLQDTPPTCVRVSSHNSVVVVGTATGRLVLADTQSFAIIHVVEPLGKAVKELRVKHSPPSNAVQDPSTGCRGEVIAVCCLGTYPAVACADIMGSVFVWTIRPYPAPLRLLGKVDLNTLAKPEKSGKGSDRRVCTSLSFHATRQDLYAGDDQGRVFCLNLTEPFERAGIAINKSLPSKKTPKNWRPGILACRHHWKAHEDELSNVSVVIDMNRVTIMTSGYDLKVYIWNTNAELVASLCQGRRINRSDERREAARQDAVKDESMRDDGRTETRAAKAKGVGRAMPPWDFKSAATMLDDFDISSDVRVLGRVGLRVRMHAPAALAPPGATHLAVPTRGDGGSALLRRLTESRGLLHSRGSPDRAAASDYEVQLPHKKTGVFLTETHEEKTPVCVADDEASLGGDSDGTPHVADGGGLRSKKGKFKRVRLPRTMKQTLLGRMHRVGRPPPRASRAMGDDGARLPPLATTGDVAAAAKTWATAAVADVGALFPTIDAAPKSPVSPVSPVSPTLSCADSSPTPRPPALVPPGGRRPPPRGTSVASPAQKRVSIAPPLSKDAEMPISPGVAYATPSPPKTTKMASPGRLAAGAPVRLPPQPDLYKKIEVTRNTLRAGAAWARLPTRFSVRPEFHQVPVTIKHPLQAKVTGGAADSVQDAPKGVAVTEAHKVLVVQQNPQSQGQSILYWADPKEHLFVPKAVQSSQVSPPNKALDR